MKRLLLVLALVLTVVIPAYSQPDFTAYTAGNPVIPKGPAGSWDVGGVWGSHLTVVNDTFYMIYTGTQDVFSQPVSIGLATSTDGYTFTKSPANPILSGDGSGFDAYSVSDAALFFDNGIWYLYYTGLASAPNLPGRIISRATADSPHGPWIRTNDALMLGGSDGEWDDQIALPLQILPIDTGLVMYYCGAEGWYPYTVTCQIGMATSTDGGQSWQKYDDPATTSPPYAESDPVLKVGPQSYDNLRIWGAGIVRHDNLWEMFYAGWPSNSEGSICYATSLDGIHWIKYSKNPIYTFWDDPLAVATGTIEIPSVALFNSTYFLYYDYGNTPASTGIGLATDSIVPPDFTAYTAGNPVIPRGSAGSWDVGLVFTPLLTVVNDTFYLCYTGSQDYSSQPFSIGLATSTDGYTFTKSQANPILSGDGSGFDAYAVLSGVLYYDNVNWYLYYTGLATAPNIPGRIISRATADNPHGPWVRTNDALLIGGSNGEWDDKITAPLQLLPTDTGLVMYYWGSDEWYPFTFTCQIGMATSTDGGQSWLKYDDPLTTSPPYAESDPVLKAGPEIYDTLSIFGAGVTRIDNKWEMFYSGSVSLPDGSICYASSYDGIHWTKYSQNPIYTFWEDPLAVNGILGMPTVAFHESRYFLFYDYGYGPNLPGIGLATDPPIIEIVPPDFTAYTAGNPVIPGGGTGSWDVGGVWGSHLTVVNDTFYMIYNGTQDLFSQPVNIGLAISTDGFTFTKSDSNPILIGDGSGFDAYSVSDAGLFFDNGSWYLYYTGLASAPNLPGRIISRVTADNPHGPWVRTNDTLLTGGSNGEWDDKITLPLQILLTDTGLVMYYCGADEWHTSPFEFKIQIGLATSTDGGQSWQKYDDPATTGPPYAESDPVLKVGDPESYDDTFIWGAGIVRHDNLWEMFYAGWPSSTEGSICYATSLDGIHWIKYLGNPIYTFLDDPLAMAPGVIEIPSVALFNSTYFLYYDYGNTPVSTGIGLAADPPIPIIQPIENKISNFQLYQNYPNPFNPSTLISWQLAVSNWVKLSVYDLTGREVVVLVNEHQAAGNHQIEFEASDLSSGVYFYKLEAGDFVMTKKLVLLR